MAPRRYLFHRERSRSRPLFVFSLLFLLTAALLIYRSQERGDIQPLFLPTPTATRMVNSFISEARMHFEAGNLDASIDAFQKALENEPTNGQLYAERARVLTYSSAMVTTDDERKARLDAALENANRAVELAPDDSTAFAIKAFALDWYAQYAIDTELDNKKGEDMLSEAGLAVGRARVLDANNLQALIYYAEIMVDLKRFQEAETALKTLLKELPENWEVHRVNSLYQEYQADYQGAIDSMKMASSLAPNITFLYIRLGQAYRTQGMNIPDDGTDETKKLREDTFGIAMEYFEKAANLNEQLGIKDPFPYLGIGYTYAQMGEFFIASRNMSKALSFNPYSPKVYGDLGVVARQGKNYELAVLALQCAIRGCDAETSCTVRQCDDEVDAPIVIEKGLQLNVNTVSYYLIYSATLAGMYVETNPDRANYCYEAVDVISEIRANPKFNSEPIYDQIMRESENICADHGVTLSSVRNRNAGGQTGPIYAGTAIAPLIEGGAAAQEAWATPNATTTAATTVTPEGTETPEN